MKNAITVSNVHKTYLQGGHRVEALKDIDLTIAEGEFFVLLGPSGSGKSTLLRIIAGLDTATSGSVAFAPGLSNNDIAFVFQQFGLLPWLSVSENITMNLVGRNVPEAEQHEKTKQALEEFGLTRFAHHMPRELSGGMRQRVGLARAFVTEPKIIFLDEPFSELDFFTAAELRKELVTLWQKTGCTIVMVSHNIAERSWPTASPFSARPGTVQSLIQNDLKRPRSPRSESLFAMEDELTAFLTKAAADPHHSTCYILLCGDDSLIPESPKWWRGTSGTWPGPGPHTRSHAPTRILYTEKLPSRSAALKREAQIKRFKRDKKLELCLAESTAA
jgi:ABC-type nitrate/sulfonate/bicarbonate transport system ATPase subunit